MMALGALTASKGASLHNLVSRFAGQAADHLPACFEIRCVFCTHSDCGTGKFNNITRQTDCSECVPGRFAEGIASTVCVSHVNVGTISSMKTTISCSCNAPRARSKAFPADSTVRHVLLGNIRPAKAPFSAPTVQRVAWPDWTRRPRASTATRVCSLFTRAILSSLPLFCFFMCAGTFSGQGASACTPCGDGHNATDGSSRCSTCPAGVQMCFSLLQVSCCTEQLIFACRSIRCWTCCGVQPLFSRYFSDFWCLSKLLVL
jgi:hypothetical protein